MAALVTYLDAVGRHLCPRGLITEEVRVFSPGQNYDLSASMTLRPAHSATRYRVGWHEELGWWIATTTDPDSTGPSARWLGCLFPPAGQVAELLDTATRRGIEHEVPPRVLRYRLTADESIVASLRRAAGEPPG